MKTNHWYKTYSDNQHLSSWPWSEVISLCNRFCKKKINNKNSKLLELGFGAGANIPFFLKQKIKYYGVEGSKNIVNVVKKKYKNKNLIHGDFSQSYFEKYKFDVILDRASITHNNKKDIHRILDDVQDKLTKKGTFIGIDWYSKNCSDFINRKSKNNYLYFKSGVFKNIGGVFFSNKKEILNFFKKFKIIHLSEKKIETFRKKKKYIVSSWSIVAEKK